MLHSLLITAITIAMLVPAGESRAQQPGAPRFVSLEGRFSVSLDRSDPRRVTMPTPFGDRVGQQYEWKTKEAGFGVAYADVHQALQQPEAANKFFDEAAEHLSVNTVFRWGVAAGLAAVAAFPTEKTTLATITGLSTNTMGTSV